MEELVLEKALSGTKFVDDIEDLIAQHKLNYVDAIIHYCTVNNIEVESAAEIIKGNLKMKAQLESEYENLNYLPKRAKLVFE
jgi:hypothetical protein